MTAPAPPHKPRVLVVVGPTGSGKSAHALALARRHGGRVINADAMQTYAELRILTARPTPADEAAAPHRLYGVRPASEPGSAATWRAAALAEIASAVAEGALPILAGGSFLYVTALMQGLAPIPEPGAAAREEARALLAALGPAGLHARLATVDPATAARLRPTDSQRVARAFEVWRGTGRGLAHWQQQRGEPAPYAFETTVLNPPAAELRRRIAARAEAMVPQGVLAEVAALLALDLDPALPLMRAHGVREFGAYLQGRMALEEALELTVQVTAQYAKRQRTWLRNGSQGTSL